MAFCCPDMTTDKLEIHPGMWDNHHLIYNAAIGNARVVQSLLLNENVDPTARDFMAMRVAMIGGENFHGTFLAHSVQSTMTITKVSWICCWKIRKFARDLEQRSRGEGQIKSLNKNLFFQVEILFPNYNRFQAPRPSQI